MIGRIVAGAFDVWIPQSVNCIASWLRGDMEVCGWHTSACESGQFERCSVVTLPRVFVRQLSHTGAPTRT